MTIGDTEREGSFPASVMMWVRCGTDDLKSCAYKERQTVGIKAERILQYPAVSRTRRNRQTSHKAKRLGLGRKDLPQHRMRKKQMTAQRLAMHGFTEIHRETYR